MKVTIVALVVVYGIPPIQTPSIQSLINCSKSGCKLKIIIWDNSPTPQDHDISSHGIEAQYISTPENINLSTIYNSVISNYIEKEDYLLLLDQDSNLPYDFLFKNVEAVKSNSDVNLFLPLVHANNRWVSPLSYICGWGKYWKSPRLGLISPQGICAINSGMLISAKYLMRTFSGYDERLRFYGTDTQFMLEYMDTQSNLYVVNSTLEHDLSFFSDATESKVRKFSDMKSANYIIYSEKPIWQRIAVFTNMLLASVFYSLKYRNIKFLWN